MGAIHAHPRAKYVIYDNGSEFKLHFESLCDSYALKRSPTTIKNPQANAIQERQHATIGDMMRMLGLDKRDSVDESASMNLSSTLHGQ